LRQKLVSLIDEAIASGARKEPACIEAGISIKTYQRWRSGDKVLSDKRADIKVEPKNKLSINEKEKIIHVCNEPAY